MVRIRLRRVGRTKAPAYRIVVADSKSPRDGKFLEIVGQYAPRQSDAQKLNVNLARVNYWLDVGAQPSDTVRSLLRRAGVMKQRHEARLGRKLQSSAVAMPEGSADTSAAVPVGMTPGMPAGMPAGAPDTAAEPLAPPPGTPVVMLRDDSDADAGMDVSTTDDASADASSADTTADESPAADTPAE